MDNREVTVASIRTKGELLIGVKSVRIHALANGGCGNHLPTISIHHSHHLIAATGKQSTVLLVHSQSAWLLAGSQGPAFYYRSFLGVDAGQLALVFNVDKDTALAVSHAKFRFAVERNIAYYLVVRGIDYRGILAAAIEGKDALGRWIIKNGVWVFALDLDLGRLLQGFQVKYRYAVLAPVAGKALA